MDNYLIDEIKKVMTDQDRACLACSEKNQRPVVFKNPHGYYRTFKECPICKGFRIVSLRDLEDGEAK